MTAGSGWHTKSPSGQGNTPLVLVLQNATPLFLAAKSNHVEIVEMLLEQQADIAVQCNMLYVVSLP